MQKYHILTFAYLWIIGCADTKFTGNLAPTNQAKARANRPAEQVKNPTSDANNPTNDSSTNCTINCGMSTPDGLLVDTFSYNLTNANKVDVAWFIDSSDSMNQEINNVAANLGKFIDDVSAKIDINVAIVGKSKVLDRLPPIARLQKFSVNITSFDALIVAASAICGVTPANRPTTYNLCGSSLEFASLGILPSNFLEINGKLSSFFRKGVSRPVIVVVTDDNAKRVDDQNFISLVKPSFSNQVPYVYAFAGLDARKTASCVIDHPGTSYVNLAQQTGGQVYDICESDWKKHFTSLTNSIVQQATTTLRLSRTASRVTKVTWNGNPLAQDAYSFINNQITINKAPSTSSSTVVVYYEPQR